MIHIVIIHTLVIQVVKSVVSASIVVIHNHSRDRFIQNVNICLRYVVKWSEQLQIYFFFSHFTSISNIKPMNLVMFQIVLYFRRWNFLINATYPLLLNTANAANKWQKSVWLND